MTHAQVTESMLLLGGPQDGKVLSWRKGEPPKVLHTQPAQFVPGVAVKVVSQDAYARTDEQNDAGQWLYRWLGT